jgi:hypothetical protein
MRHKLYLAVVFAFLLTTVGLAPPAHAQQATTRPAAAAATWPEATSRLSRALVGKDITELATVVAGIDKMTRFGSDAYETPDRLLSATTGMTVLGVHAYAKTPATLASDLAGDFRDNESIPMSVRREMIPVDDAAAKRADVTAAQWLAQILRPEKEQPVGVIVLWPDPRRKDGIGSTSPRPTFVLVKGEATGDGYRITQLIYGDPLHAER